MYSQSVSRTNIGGAPVGSAEYAAKFVADIVDKHRDRPDHIAKLGEAGHTQEELLLLRQCACPRITFLLQCVPYNIAPQAFDTSYRASSQGHHQHIWTHHWHHRRTRHD